METGSEIKRAFDYLHSQEGTIQYLMEKTLLPRERVERIYQLGKPWPVSVPKGWEHQQACIDALLHDVPYPGDTDPLVALNALNELRELDIEQKERKLEAYIAAVERGETPGPTPEFEMSSDIDDHLEEVAKLSGESIETIYGIYSVELARLLEESQLILQICKLRAKEEKDIKGG